MRMVCLSRESDIAVGLKLAGVESFHIEDIDEIKEKLKEVAKDPNVGIINVTEDVYELAKEDIDKIMSFQTMPLVVVIPNTK